MDAQEDYAAYVAARWPALVRSAVFLGCSVPEAEDLVQSTLVKCYTAWDKVQRANNPDSYVYGILLNTHRTNLRRTWPQRRSTVPLVEAAVSDETANV